MEISPGIVGISDGLSHPPRPMPATDAAPRSSVHSNPSPTHLLPDQHPKSAFLSLPLELRHEIYSHAVNPYRDFFSRYDLPFIAEARSPSTSCLRDYIHESNYASNTLQPQDALPSLLTLNRQISNEILHWFPRNRSIHCNGLPSLAQFLRSTPASFLVALRSLTLHINRVAQALPFREQDLLTDPEEEPLDPPDTSSILKLLESRTGPSIEHGDDHEEAELRGEYGIIRRSYHERWRGVGNHLAFHGESYGDFRAALGKLGGLREFTVNFVNSGELEFDDLYSDSFMDFLRGEMYYIFRAVPVKPVEGGIYRVVGGNADVYSKMEFQRWGGRFCGNDDDGEAIYDIEEMRVEAFEGWEE